ncbi:hypothetical protein B0T26DRAFT_739060 [Lasiosphaeria miniovina]|uniref:SET domain-containing protein n=1 Tax=Lasiosphaeria miniovina TaxID=1954250 RepID=A0AA40B722_9PEZI|nr:uncharacterized protein B0T26DRAFT_739060 [Lasiosphaeria miniovina]KAK0728850.1 hypothetical protein B0T26DRAFT_739060 [Lasiosphaeria miniovina]
MAARPSTVGLQPQHLGSAVTQCPRNVVHPTSLSGSCPVAVDDETDDAVRANANTPWTHPPYCVVPKASGSDGKFCVFSASGFNLGSGISIIATPDTAASLVAAVQNPQPAWHARHHLAQRDRLPEPEQDHPGSGSTDKQRRPYAIVSIPGRGRGAVATRRIAQFETIMTSFPAVVADNVFFPEEDGGGPAEGRWLFQRALDQLADRQRFLGLARSKGPHVHAVEDVLRTNAFGITVNGRDAKGLYPEIARLNHACDPNAYGRFTKTDLALSAVATRDIVPGEEITISYLPLGMPTAYRARGLANWNFNCTCTLCSSPAAARAASDRRRERLVDILQAMYDEATEYGALVELTREFVDVVRTERLDAKVGEYFHAFMRIYHSFGDVESAFRYGQTALWYAETFADPEGGFCAGLRQDVRLLGQVLKERGSAEA